ncbi:MAG TPA: DUF3592 domain-containing protein [Fimbriimonas sp.]|nr:DUF3592 domain-containing protein [Fimbriimonas sp.]
MSLFSLFALVAATCFISASVIRLKEKRLLASGTRTVATVLSRRREEVRYSSSDEYIERRTYFRDWVCFEARVGGRLIEKEAIVSSKVYSSFRPGQQVAAVYPEDRPEDIRLVDEVIGSTSLQSLLLIGVVFLLFAGVVVGMANSALGS